MVMFLFHTEESHGTGNSVTMGECRTTGDDLAAVTFSPSLIE